MAIARSMRPIKALTYAGFSSIFIPVAVTASSTVNTCRSSPLLPSSQQCSAYSTSTSSSSGAVSYRLAVAYCGKGRKIQAHKDVKVFDITSLRTKGQTGLAGAPPRSGQDAFFMASLGNDTNENVAFGVADGVGGWTESGIDPSAFSEGLCRHMVKTAGSWDDDGKKGKLDPRTLMQAGYDGVIKDPEVEGGGSTAVVAIGRTNGEFEVANLGDSGFAHYRPNAMAFFSPPQTHAFNTPYQLSLIPPAIMRQYQDFGGSPLMDMPRDAAVSRHEVRHGDVLVFGSDGVWDNLNSSDVLDIVRKEMGAVQAWVVDEDDNGAVVGGHDLADKTAWRRQAVETDGHGDGKEISREDKTAVSIQEKLAYRIVQKAQAAAVDMKRPSPFGRELMRYYPGESWQGGKVDDVAVVVAVIVDA